MVVIIILIKMIMIAIVLINNNTGNKYYYTKCSGKTQSQTADIKPYSSNCTLI